MNKPTDAAVSLERMVELAKLTNQSANAYARFYQQYLAEMAATPLPWADAGGGVEWGVEWEVDVAVFEQAERDERAATEGEPHPRAVGYRYLEYMRRARTETLPEEGERP